MNRIPRWNPDWESLDDAGWETFVPLGYSYSVRRERKARYFACFSRYVDFCVRKDLPIGLPALTRFLHGMRSQGAKGKTVEAYRCGVLFVQRVYGLAQFATEKDLCDAIQGYIYFDKLHCVQRGAITQPMLDQLITVDSTYAPAFLLIFFAVLRVGQFSRLLVGDAVILGDQCTLTLRQDKRNRAGTVQTHITHKTVVMPVAKAVLEAAQVNRPRGEVMFPWFSEVEANQIIHTAAIQFGWPTGLVYDGVHCLRHGGCQAAKVFIAKLLAQLGPVAGMAPSTVVGVYARLNEARIQAEQVSESDDED